MGERDKVITINIFSPSSHMRFKTPVCIVAVAALLVCPAVIYSANTTSLDLENVLNQHVYVGDGAQEGLDLADTLTLEMWVKFASIPGREYFIMKRLGPGQRSYSWYLNNANTLAFDWHNDGVSGTFANVTWTPEAERWYHLAIVKSGTEVRFLADGTQIGDAQYGDFSGIFDSAAPFEIGHYQELDAEGDSFDGLMDDVRVWNVARTAEEIADNMNKELTGTEPGLVGYWRLNGDFTDASGNGNNLTPVNGPGFSNDVPFSDAPPMTPVEQANALIASVEAQDLPLHVIRSYAANLKKVPRFIEEEKFDAALSQLIAFVHKVQGHQADGTIEEAVAESLLEQAEALMLAII